MEERLPKVVVYVERTTESKKAPSIAHAAWSRTISIRRKVAHREINEHIRVRKARCVRYSIGIGPDNSTGFLETDRLLHTNIRSIVHLTLNSHEWRRERASILIKLRARIERISTRTDMGLKDRLTSAGCSRRPQLKDYSHPHALGAGIVLCMAGNPWTSSNHLSR
jgi:hypothetical protein